MLQVFMTCMWQVIDVLGSFSCPEIFRNLSAQYCYVQCFLFANALSGIVRTQQEMSHVLELSTVTFVDVFAFEASSIEVRLYHCYAPPDKIQNCPSFPVQYSSTGDSLLGYDSLLLSRWTLCLGISCGIWVFQCRTI